MLFRTATALAALAAATSASALNFTTTGNAMVEGRNGFTVAPVWTVGDTIGTYTPPGIPDGIGAWRSDASTVRVLLNHEIAAGLGYAYSLANGTQLDGARISYFDIDRNSRTVTAAGLAYDAIYDRAGAVVADPAAQLTFGALSRLCSGQAFEPDSFGGGRGVVDRIYFAGEESGNGTMFALDTANRALHAVPDMGYASWENAAQVDTGTTDKVAFLLSDDSSGAAMLLYVGTKDTNPGAGFLARNGLEGGKLYAWKADDGADSPAEFRGNGTAKSGSWVELTTRDPAKAGTAGYDADGFALQATLQAEADAKGAFSFSRPEDVDVNPADSTLVALNSTGASGFDGGADTWGMTYTMDLAFDASGNPADTTTRIVYDGNADPAHRIRNPDNLDWADADTIIINEDRAADWASIASVNPEEAGILLLDLGGAVREAGRINRVTSFGQVDTLPGDFGNWETSGVLDVGYLFGRGDGLLFLSDVQAHSIKLDPDVLVEGGQLFFLESAVPEPATWAMMIGGFGLVGRAMRRRVPVVAA